MLLKDTKLFDPRVGKIFALENSTSSPCIITYLSGGFPCTKEKADAIVIQDSTGLGFIYVKIFAHAEAIINSDGELVAERECYSEPFRFSFQTLTDLTLV